MPCDTLSHVTSLIFRRDAGIYTSITFMKEEFLEVGWTCWYTYQQVRLAYRKRCYSQVAQLGLRNNKSGLNRLARKRDSRPLNIFFGERDTDILTLYKYDISSITSAYVRFIIHMATSEILPVRLRESMRQLGRGISIARRRRKLTAAMMAERIGVGRQTYQRVEQGDPNVAMGTYLMALFVLGLEWGGLERSADPQADETGTALDLADLPKTVRPKRTPRPK